MPVSPAPAPRYGPALPRPPARARCVLVWDDVECDRWGDEYRVWYASYGDDDGEPIGSAWRHGSERAADAFATTLGRRFGLEVVNH